MGLLAQRQNARAYLMDQAAVMQTEACTVRHPGPAVADGYGGYTPGAVTSVATVCQRLASLSDAERELAGRLAIIRPVVLLMPLATVIDEYDQVVIGADVLEVKGVSSGTWSLRLRVLCNQLVAPGG